MLLVETKIGISKIAGIGLFANQFIPKGTPVWKFEKGFDLEISRIQFEKLSKPAQDQVMNYCYFNNKTEMFIICSDDARFFNHSENPNVDSDLDDEHIDKALRDIQSGEELTQDYRIFDNYISTKFI